MTASQGTGGRERYLHSARGRGDELPEVSPLKPQPSCSPPCPWGHGTAERWAALSCQGKSARARLPPCPWPASASPGAGRGGGGGGSSARSSPSTPCALHSSAYSLPRDSCPDACSRPDNGAGRGWASLPHLKAKPGDTAQSCSLLCGLGLPARTLHPAEGRPCQIPPSPS